MYDIYWNVYDIFCSLLFYISLYMSFFAFVPPCIYYFWLLSFDPPSLTSLYRYIYEDVIFYAVTDQDFCKTVETFVSKIKKG